MPFNLSSVQLLSRWHATFNKHKLSNLRPGFLARSLFCLLIVSGLGSCGGQADPERQESPLYAGEFEDEVEKTTGPADPRPDIVLVVADDMRWDLMSGEGHPYLDTPNLDAFAHSAAKMNKAFVPVALCSPSRAAILTGRDPHQASAPGIVWRNNSFLQNQRTFAENLQEAGYTTAYIGKWHMGDGATPKRGFDHWESFDWLGDFFDPVVHVNGQERQYRGYADDVLSARADLFLEAHRESGKPVFLMVGLKAPHLQFEHPARHKHKFEGVGIPKPDTYNEDFSVSGKLQAVKDWLGMDTFHCGLNCFDDSWDKYIKYHYRAILGLDDSIGTLRAALRHRGKTDNTLFIYTSDNGYSLGDHGLTEKHMLYEEPIRVPFLVDFPGDEDRGLQFDGLVSTVDIAPTALSYAGVAIPSYMKGQNLKTLVDSIVASNATDADIPWRDELFFTYDGWQIAVRTDKYKYIESLKVDGHVELYDLEVDPNETRSVHADSDYTDALADMRHRLERLRIDNGWTPRIDHPVRQVLVSSPLPSVNANNAAIAASLRDDLATGTEDTSGLTWQLVERTDHFQLGNGIPRGSSVLVALPIERLSDWDPHVTVRLGGQYPMAMFVRGQALWDNYQRRPIDFPNPPLKTGTTLVVMRVDGSGSMSMSMGLRVASATVRLPLEDKVVLSSKH